MKTSLSEFIANLPKAELHLHIEGSLEPEMMFALAKRNSVKIPFTTIDEVRAAYNFRDLKSFLDLYFAGTAVLQTETDFYELTKAYVEKAITDNIRHSELFFDPQTHTDRGVPISAVFAGIARALREARSSDGFSSKMIMCFLRHLSEEDAFETLQAALPLRADHTDLWCGVGLDSSEFGNPPKKFSKVFDMARELGFRIVAHAGEEGPPEYIWEALEILKVERVDHGIKCETDERLVKYLAEHRIPLTVCPLSNLKLCVVKKIEEHNLVRLLRSGLCITINSDDPPYFGGYINDNFIAVASAFNLTGEDLVDLARNSFRSSFADDEQKMKWLQEIDEYADNRAID